MLKPYLSSFQNGLNDLNDWDSMADTVRGTSHVRREMYRKCFTSRNGNFFPREPLFKGTGWPECHENWYTASYRYYLGNNIGDFWFLSFCLFCPKFHLFRLFFFVFVFVFFPFSFYFFRLRFLQTIKSTHQQEFVTH